MKTPTTGAPPAPATRHSQIEDAQGLAFGIFMCAFALVPLRDLGLITGQTAGLAVLLSYLTPLSFGALFFVVNLPFYWLGWKRMGLRFVVKTFACVAGLSLCSEIFPAYISFSQINPIFGAVLFGFCSGAGLLAIFRHGGSLGGVGILALYLQEATGFKAGWTQLLFDAVLFGIAALLLPLPQVAYSLLGAMIVNLVIAINHRRDHYVAT
ncbi:hypothetical protein AQS8620_01705 [Aquimixticola soesokkakensis]|uniref:5xTM membrane BCR, YitT family n=1 Tax=Aquimixticola soesokkakensis TaxID=1519096 RepID=A0A1Y5SKY9_9RHOB|nr:YitT family protein [Aquimixticola soesokkakensis]SLN42589.1 hypothetical protein AQS8620_01705 [Aquimixticola soesokkakensis]